MRRLPALVAVTALAGFGLVGCSASAASSCPTPTDSAIASVVDASGDFGTAPTVSVRSPFVPETAGTQTLIEGDGQRITSDNQLSLVDVTVFDAATGSQLVATTYASDVKSATPLPRLTQAIPAIAPLLHCVAEGSRVAVAIPGSELGTQGAQALGVNEGDGAVFVFDVRKVFLPAADGADQYNADSGMPSVVRAPDGTPGVVIPAGDAPTQTRSQTIKKGDGDVLTADSSVVIHIQGVAWGATTTFASTWKNGAPGQATVSQLPPALASALEGQTVGSQVLVVVPADQTAQDQQILKAPANSALVYVVDVLGTVS
ncbi:FKBP-type peptidyl-prolyl cis-trans isomerase [Microbacterium testaceum]|uniref:FKBP-type peptidyl-prolyl cis-trans isomerase n=1 Tax=Microbacterium testaceum TaxID=2033 RepID=UPI0025B1015B|nr:FKBP-type peptidyl-prolyl cis-trans isomerase [Microbacterium testaceum]WJS92331.1 FKBP-type peptidyl-prolyl cis-trans isomerase [Microbacterium testaceum]